MSELLYAGKTLDQIAGWDSIQLSRVIARPRNKYGELLRTDPSMPRFVQQHLDADGCWRIEDPQPFGAAYHQMRQAQGMNSEEARKSWYGYVYGDPTLRSKLGV